MVRELPLTTGGVTLVDDDVYEWASLSAWYGTGRGNKYVRRSSHKREWLHRSILNAPDNVLVDHINRNPLDNRRENLRLATRSQSEQNKTGALPRSQTGIRNVWWNPRRGLYESYITVDGKQIYAGRSKSLEGIVKKVAAARAKHMPYSAEAREASTE